MDHQVSIFKYCSEMNSKEFLRDLDIDSVLESSKQMPSGRPETLKLTSATWPPSGRHPAMRRLYE